MKINIKNFVSFLLGFAIGTIIWSFLWISLIKKIDKIHKQEIEFLIEKHNR